MRGMVLVAAMVSAVTVLASNEIGVIRVGRESAATNTIMAIENVRMDLRRCFEKKMKAAVIVGTKDVPAAVFEAISALDNGRNVRVVDARMDDPGKASAAMEKELEAKLLAPGVNPCLIPRWKCYEPVERIRNEGQKAGGKLVVDVVMIGDSITAGWGGKGAAALKKYVNGWNIFNMACSGDQIQDQLGNCLWGGLDGYQTKIVQIMIGTNNARNDTPENMAGGIRRIVELVRGKQPDARVFLMPIFPRGEANDRARAENEKVNALIRRLADGDKVVLFEMKDCWLDANGDCRKDLMSDRVHPNEAGYELWASAMKPLWERARAEWKGDPEKVLPVKITDRTELEKRFIFHPVTTNTWELEMPVDVLTKGDDAVVTPGDLGPGACRFIDGWLNRHKGARLLIHKVAEPDDAKGKARIAGVNAFYSRQTGRWGGFVKYCPFLYGDKRTAPYIVSLKKLEGKTYHEAACYYGPVSYHSNGWDWWARGVKHRKMIDSGEVRDCDIVFWGDSITHYWELHGQEAMKKHFGNWKIFNIAVYGDSVRGCVWNAENGLLDGYKTKCVMLMIGTNNGGAPGIVPGVKRLLDLIREKQPQAVTFLLPIFPRGADYKKGGARAEKFGTNAMLQKLCDGDRVRWVDFNDKFLDAGGRLPASVMPDFVHPSADGYEIWAQAMEPHFRKVLHGAGPERRIRGCVP